MTLGERIKQIRTLANLSQEEFANELNTTKQTISRWELDMCYPEIDKIVLMSEIFNVTIDSILKDNISTFKVDNIEYECGVYRSHNKEICQSEKFVITYYYANNTLGVKLYLGFKNKKNLVAILEKNTNDNSISYAYYINNKNDIVSNNEDIKKLLNEKFNNDEIKSMKKIESFKINHSNSELPTIKNDGIKKCLKEWRMHDFYRSNDEELYFYLYTGNTEYVFQVVNKDSNIYCGASYNQAFDLGIYSYKQYFRIRNYKDNSLPFCNSFADFSVLNKEVEIPLSQCKIGECILINDNYIWCIWCIKRYNDNEIVLQGCGDDEYIYKRNESFIERITK